METYQKKVREAIAWVEQVLLGKPEQVREVMLGRWNSCWKSSRPSGKNSQIE